ncbi:hypothetical protein K431DRAFT_341896 [Polychaeton citri CBS 116435]|uniref:Uncharacterized protein n=1 Tax=Polychaeton citri CBS 116435 TaxID=1314669 RepID=A0A9P4Q1D0_9PEZI|nr:hypothetical protein K431DRAFT_341896 [Polychaeton citri CBS 116435]
MLLIVRLFHEGIPESLSTADDLKQHLAATGLSLEEEYTHTLPQWRRWALIAAKPRTIYALHHVAWAWSVLHGYPMLSCLELAPLPAPEPGFLWCETDGSNWEKQFCTTYKMAELFEIKPGNALDPRSEMWLSEIDEYGMILMAEGAYPLSSLIVLKLIQTVNSTNVTD